MTPTTLESLNAAAAMPEMLLAAGVCVLLIIDGLTQGKKLDFIHNVSVALAALLGIWCLCAAGEAKPELAFNEMYINDSMGLLLKGFTCLAVAITLVYAKQYAADRDMLRGEFYGLSLFALLGQMVMISANTFLLIYLGLELLSLSLYAAVAMRRDHLESSEASMKYFVLGALASGFLLYGMSMVYGAAGSLELSAIAKATAAPKANQMVLVFGLVFLVSGLAFKLGVVPFHMWVPDVYQGSPTATTLLISAAPKLAAFAMLIRILVDGLLSAAADWQQMLMFLSILSMGIGNLAAIAQTNLKRMLAYSTIAQMGFMLLGMMSGVVDKNQAGAAAAYSASMFYVVTYVLTTLGTFGVMLLLSRKGLEAENISDLNGLNARAPWMALVMLVLMFSLAGIPPMVGFYAKLAVLQAVFAAGHVTLTVYAVMMSLIGAFYYLRVVKAMYFEEPSDTTPVAGGRPSALLGLNGAAVVVLGLLPAPLMGLCLTAMQRVLGS